MFFQSQELASYLHCAVSFFYRDKKRGNETNRKIGGGTGRGIITYFKILSSHTDAMHESWYFVGKPGVSGVISLVLLGHGAGALVHCHPLPLLY